MSFLKLFQYVYIIFAAFFVYDAYVKYQNNESVTMSLLLAAAAVFMFFFRRRFNNKYGK
ncbi:hypothetical protein FLGE108171_04910 [Flavobacterium gelidilacus]|jgi:hypothetical protein